MRLVHAKDLAEAKEFEEQPVEEKMEVWMRGKLMPWIVMTNNTYKKKGFTIRQPEWMKNQDAGMLETLLKNQLTPLGYAVFFNPSGIYNDIVIRWD
jgi:hypothetical protein